MPSVEGTTVNRSVTEHPSGSECVSPFFSLVFIQLISFDTNFKFKQEISKLVVSKQVVRKDSWKMHGTSNDTRLFPVLRKGVRRLSDYPLFLLIY